ncbi:hypothetical protein BJ138DRAFT_996759, partial [Hygrophoropsis aurantiaca]
VVNTVLQGIAILLTFWRLWYRLWIRKFGCDDAWAALASMCGLGCVVSGQVYLYESNKAPIFAFWVYLLAFPCVVWTVRMSILYSITRLIPSPTTSSRISRSFMALFLLLWGLLILQKAYKCGSNHCWYTSPSRTCQLPHIMYIYELGTDIISDFILVMLPLRMLWNIKFPGKTQRKLILSTFSASIVVSLVSVFRVVCRVMEIHSLIVTATEYEVISCLVVCNLLVAVTYLYRQFITGEDSDSSTGSGSANLTTIDLENLGDESIRSRRVSKSSSDLRDDISSNPQCRESQISLPPRISNSGSMHICETLPRCIHSRAEEDAKY